MKCTTVLSQLGFECEPLATGALRLWTPFAYGDDGELIGLYVEPVAGHFRITDHADSLFHTSAMGISLSKPRLRRLAALMRGRANLSEAGEIAAVVNRESDVPDAVTDVVDSALVISHMERMWAPKASEADFQYRVERLLAPRLGARLKRRVQVTGASGHQLEIPFMITFEGGARYVQPVARSAKGIDWANVYKAYGKMTDLKHAGADEDTRYVVVEDDVENEEIDKAVSFLTDSATVLRFSNYNQWLERLIAA